MINSLHVRNPDEIANWCVERGYVSGVDYDYWWLGEDNSDRGYLFIFHKVEDMLACKLAVPADPHRFWD